jgi:hypothetical protein
MLSIEIQLRHNGVYKKRRDQNKGKYRIHVIFIHLFEMTW